MVHSPEAAIRILLSSSVLPRRENGTRLEDLDGSRSDDIAPIVKIVQGFVVSKISIAVAVKRWRAELVKHQLFFGQPLALRPHSVGGCSWRNWYLCNCSSLCGSCPAFPQPRGWEAAHLFSELQAGSNACNLQGRKSASTQGLHAV